MLLAVAIGALVGGLVFGVFAAFPYLMTNLSTTAAEVTNGGAPSASSGWLNAFHNGAQGIALIAGAVVGFGVAVSVMRRVLRAMPVHSGPLRPTDTEN